MEVDNFNFTSEENSQQHYLHIPSTLSLQSAATDHCIKLLEHNLAGMKVEQQQQEYCEGEEPQKKRKAELEFAQVNENSVEIEEENQNKNENNKNDQENEIAESNEVINSPQEEKKVDNNEGDNENERNSQRQQIEVQVCQLDVNGEDELKKKETDLQSVQPVVILPAKELLITRKSVLKKEKEAYRTDLYIIKPSRTKHIQWNEEAVEIILPRESDVSSRNLINGIKTTHENQQAFRIFEGGIKVLLGVQIQTLKVTFNTFHDKYDIRMIPRLIFRSDSESKGVDYFAKKVSNDITRSISSMKRLQKHNYQRFFCGWVESADKEDQNNVNNLCEQMVEGKYILEYDRFNSFTIWLVPSDSILDGIEDLAIQHKDYKIITQLAVIIILPQGYYDRFAEIKEFA